MVSYLEQRPLLLVLVIVAIVAAAVGEYVVKRRNGTWVPYRRRPVQGGTGRRVFGIVFATGVLAFGAWVTYQSATAGQSGSAITGVALMAFALYLSWVTSQVGLDVTQQQHESTTWRRPAIAWWVAAQGAGLGVLGLVLLVIGAVQDAPVWFLALSVGALLAGPVMAWVGLRLRVPDLRGGAAGDAKTPRAPDRGH